MTSTSDPVSDPPPKRPVWNPVDGLPKEFGDLEGLLMPHERIGDGTWNPDSAPLACGQTSIVLPALSELVGGRTATAVVEGEFYNSESSLLFATEADAKAFMTQLRDAITSCAAAAPQDSPYNNADSPHERHWFALHNDEGQPDAFAYTSWIEIELDKDNWVESPGGDMAYFARNGRAVLRGHWGGEMVGDVVFRQPQDYEMLRSRILESLVKA